MTRARGWLPDPTRRHQLRFWDGDVWTADVSDGSTVSFDPGEVPVTPPPPDPSEPSAPAWPPAPEAMPEATAPGASGAPSSPPASAYADPTTVFSSPAPHPENGIQPGAPRAGSPGSGPGHGPGSGPGRGPEAAPGPGMAGAPAGGPHGDRPQSSRWSRSSWLVVTVVVLAAAVAVGGYLAIQSGSDDDPGSDGSSAARSTTASGPSGGSSDDETTSSGGPSSSLSVDQLMVAAVAQGIVDGSDGAIDEAEAVCMGEALIDEVGIGRLAEVTEATAEEPGTNPLDLLTEEERTAAMTRMRTCVDQATLDSLSPSRG